MLHANFIHSLRTTLCAALSLGLVACAGIDSDTVGESESEGDATSESATDTEGESESSTSGASASDTDGSGSETQGNTSTTGDSTTGEDPTSTGEVSTSGSTGSTGGQADSIPESCEAACEVVYVCLVDEYDSMEACVADCVEEITPEEASAECEAAVIGFANCVAGATCEEFDNDIFCEAEEHLMVELCDLGGDECIVGIGGDSESCGITEECDDGSMELRCEGDSCLCLLNDEEVGSCENDICVDELDPNGLYDKAITCCGFEF